MHGVAREEMNMIPNQYIDSPSWQLDYSGKPTAKKNDCDPTSRISSAILLWKFVQSKSLLFSWLCLGRHVLTAPLLLASMAWAQLNPEQSLWSLVFAYIRLAMAFQHQRGSYDLSTPRHKERQTRPSTQPGAAWFFSVRPSRLDKFAETNI